MCGVRVRAVELLVDFRGGLRRPLHDNAIVEVWINMEHVGSLSGETVRHLIQHHMTDFEIRRHVAAELGSLYTTPLRKPLAGFDAEQRATFRAKRRAKK